MNRLLKSIRDALRAAIILVLQNVMSLFARDVTALSAEGPILVIAPHPDDETLGCGAFIARARELKQDVRIVVVTDGRVSPYPIRETSGQLAAMRREEMIRAAAVLGVGADNIVFIDIPDGEAKAQESRIADALRRQIETFQPKLVLAPYGVDGHPDHQAVADVLDNLCRIGVVKCRVLEYPIWFWLRIGVAHMANFKNIQKLCSANMHGFAGAKMLAMRAHQSQCPHLFGEDYSQSFFQPLSFSAQFFDRNELFFEKTNP